MNNASLTYLQTLKQSGLNRNIPNISEENARFIGRLLAKKQPKHILEIGTANGYSALSFLYWIEYFSSEKPLTNDHTDPAQSPHSEPPIAHTEAPRIFTLEYAWNAHNEAVEHFRNCKAKNIFPIWGDAKAVIPALADGLFDVVYIDAMKKEYLDYLLLSLPKMTDDALIILDDVEKFAHKMPNLYEFLHIKNIPYHLEKTDADDSIMLINRRDIPTRIA